MSTNRDSKVIGYYALAGTNDIVCNDNACLIAGTESSMQSFAEDSDRGIVPNITIHKIRFAQIVVGLKRGAPYAFEDASFARFYPLAVEIGLPIPSLDFAEAKARGDRFLKVQLFRA